MLDHRKRLSEDGLLDAAERSAVADDEHTTGRVTARNRT
jgi:hypothetical protein